VKLKWGGSEGEIDECEKEARDSKDIYKYQIPSSSLHDPSFRSEDDRSSISKVSLPNCSFSLDS